MKLDDWIMATVGKKIDFDGYYGAHCVDLFRDYNKRVLGNPHTGAVEGAKDLFLNYENLPEEKKYFLKLSKKTKLITGDVLVFGATTSNRYGHVAIYIGDVLENQLLVYEQDGFAQDGAKFKIRSGENLIGVLRAK